MTIMSQVTLMTVFITLNCKTIHLEFPRIILVFARNIYSGKDPKDCLKMLDTYLQVDLSIQLIGMAFKKNLRRSSLFSGVKDCAFRGKLQCQKIEDDIPCLLLTLMDALELGMIKIKIIMF